MEAFAAKLAVRAARARIMPAARAYALAIAALFASGASAFDPTTPGGVVVSVQDEHWHDPPRARTLPIRVRLPQPCVKARSAPLVLFSHGLGGSVDAGTRWAQRWATHGIAVLHLQHPGSDESIWRGRPGGFDAANLRAGMSASQYFERIRDVKFALSEAIRRAETDPAWACVDARRAGMAGHSFGAITTQVIAGYELPGSALAPGALRDPRIRAAIAFSPSARSDAPDVLAGFGAIRIPFFAITGTQDEVPALNDVPPRLRAIVYEALPSGGKHLAVFDGGDHMVFGGHRMARPASANDVRIQSAVASLTTAFWLAYLSDDAGARHWLAHDGPRTAAPGDRVESK